MLRKRALQKWKECKEKALTNKKNQLTKSEIEFFSLLANELTSIGSFNNDIPEVNIINLKCKATRLNNNFSKVRQKYLSMSFSEEEDSPSQSLDLTYMSYREIVKMYQEFVKALEKLKK